MTLWMRIFVVGWPSKTRIRIFLREGSKDGKGLTGDVVIVARKGDNVATTQQLGLPAGTSLIANVVNGRWESPEWDYNYWADQGFNRLVAQHNSQESYWSSEKPAVPVVAKPIAPPAPVPDNLWDYTGFPNSDGSFQVTFTTRNGNSPVQGKFLIQAISETMVTELDGTAIGVGRRFSLETDADGSRILLLNPKDRRTEFAFTNQANTKKYTVEFVKPPAKGKEV